ncbi:MAG TPA: S-methyl-5-thioribose-1-phosphate isomerase, partial [Nitrososphaera sp.]|nr:S-methyl-5-thioribose-1-phosphate isomerase [Nitrososphaera sp.]
MAHNLDLLLTVSWENNSVVLIDQTKLPNRLVHVRCSDYKEVADAIKKLVVRGAPAIGVTAAFGFALAAQASKAKTLPELMTDLDTAFKVLRATRPTAVNLFWALERVMGKAKRAKTVGDVKKVVLDEARRMSEEDIKANRQMGSNGAALFRDGDVVLTHCNAGSLATVAYGTALGVIRAARESGKRLSVIATETRPVMQGSRLTAFELQHDGVDVSLIPDTAVGHMMSRGAIKRVIVGADRVLRTGHVFNKIGTYQVAILASRHKVPFYVAAPLSTFDFESSPEDVVIEERSVDEVVKVGKKRVAPKGVRIFNPAFDMTPPELIT